MALALLQALASTQISSSSPARRKRNMETSNMMRSSYEVNALSGYLGWIERVNKIICWCWDLCLSHLTGGIKMCSSLYLTVNDSLAVKNHCNGLSGSC